VVQFSSTLFWRIVLCSLPSFVFLVAIAAVSSPCVLAQEQSDIAAEGYITAVNPPKGFDVNGEHVLTFSGTAYGLMGSDMPGSDNSLRSALRVGSYVQVLGEKDRLNLLITPAIAKKVLFRDDWDSPITGFGVIDKVISNEPEPIFQADGYRIRINSATKTVFSEGLKTLADVGANTWMDYKGKRDTAGVLVASRVEFISAKPAHFKAIAGWETPDIQFEPPHSSLKGSTSPGSDAPADGASDQETVLTQDGKVKIGPLGGWHKIPANQALQDRVRRVGMHVVPDYQRQFPANHPSKIDFRFYAIDDARDRAEFCSADGLILIPTQVVERLKSDDQLAAVLADGVAYNLERQAARAVKANRIAFGGLVAGSIGGGFSAWLALAGEEAATAGEPNGLTGDPMAMQEQRGRVALSLLADAGYDLRQAPEAWRLLAPKHLPSNFDSLKYPMRSGYQLAILILQYNAASAAAAPNTAP
jgi:hypothetical protein